MYVGKPRERWLGDFENYLKKVGVETGENQLRQKSVEIDPEGGQGPTWTLEPVEERERECTC